MWKMLADDEINLNIFINRYHAFGIFITHQKKVLPNKINFLSDLLPLGYQKFLTF